MIEIVMIPISWEDTSKDDAFLIRMMKSQEDAREELATHLNNGLEVISSVTVQEGGSTYLVFTLYDSF